MTNLINFYGPRFGPFCLGAMAFLGAFSRGGVNSAYGILLLWGILYPVFRNKWLFRPAPPLPSLWLEALALFTGVYVLASLAGNAPLRSLGHTCDLLYPLLAFPLAWLALSQFPDVRHLTPLLYAFGTMICAVLVVKEAGWGLVCVRAKGDLGTTEVASVMGQLAPVMVGAMALALRKGRKWRPWLFLAALAACFAALQANCGRIGLICAPLLSVLMFLVNWRAFGWKTKLSAALLLALATFATLQNPAIVGRFKEMAVAEGNSNNELRKFLWRNGLKAFQEHPVLGNGPGAIPGPPPDEIPVIPGLDIPIATWSPYYSAHQVFINVMAETGLVGLIAFMSLHLAPLVLIRRNLASRDPEVFFWSWAAVAVAAQFAMNGLTDQVFGLKPLMYVYWSVTATAVWLPVHKEAQAKGRPSS